MEFNKDLYELSKMNYAFSKKNGLDEEILLKQKKLLKLMIDKLRVTRPNNNLIKISFKSSSFEGSDEGYTLIKELVQLNKFNTFFSEYFIYITKIDVANEVRRLSSFEITWDYLNYYEAICNRGIGRTRTMFEVVK